MCCVRWGDFHNVWDPSFWIYVCQPLHLISMYYVQSTVQWKTSLDQVKINLNIELITMALSIGLISALVSGVPAAWLTKVSLFEDSSEVQTLPWSTRGGLSDKINRHLPTTQTCPAFLSTLHRYMRTACYRNAHCTFILMDCMDGCLSMPFRFFVQIRHNIVLSTKCTVSSEFWPHSESRKQRRTSDAKNGENLRWSDLIEEGTFVTKYHLTCTEVSGFYSYKCLWFFYFPTLMASYQHNSAPTLMWRTYF